MRLPAARTTAPDRRYIVDHAAAGLRIDHADMRQRRIGRQRARQRRSDQWCRSGPSPAAPAPGPPPRPGGSCGRHRRRWPGSGCARRAAEGAQCGLGDEMPAALQRQGRRAGPRPRRQDAGFGCAAGPRKRRNSLSQGAMSRVSAWRTSGRVVTGPGIKSNIDGNSHAGRRNPSTRDRFGARIGA